MMTLTQELELKKKLLQESTKLLNMQIQAAKDAMDEAQESANEHQGAIEDKFESFREACQIQRDMYARQLDELITTMGALKRVNSTKENKEVSFGAVVMTELQNYYIGVSLGEIKIDGESSYAISGLSRRYTAVEGKTGGDSFVIRDNTDDVVQVF